MNMRHYILVGQSPVVEPDLMTWMEWYEHADRIVAQTEVPGGVVSTVFLGLDHNFSRTGPPLLFETMAFIDGEAGNCRRTATWLDAEAMHAATVALHSARSRITK